MLHSVETGAIAFNHVYGASKWQYMAEHPYQAKMLNAAMSSFSSVVAAIEAARELKKMLPQTPIVLFTSYHAALQCFDARAVGIDAVISKDAGMSLLIDSLQELLQEAR